MASPSEYHGFIIKVFEEPYMVKEGPFLNADKDYPTRRSKLVDSKRSKRIMEDVFSFQVSSVPVKAPKENQMAKPSKKAPKSVPPVERESSVCDSPAIEVAGAAHALDEEMPDSQAPASQKECIQMLPTFEPPLAGQKSKDDRQMAGIVPLERASSYVRVGGQEKPKDDANFSETMDNGTEVARAKLILKPHSQEESPVCNKVEKSVPQIILHQLEDEVSLGLHREDDNDDLMTNYQCEEIAKAKLKLIIRYCSLFRFVWILKCLPYHLAQSCLLHVLYSGYGSDVLQNKGSCESKGSLLPMLH